MLMAQVVTNRGRERKEKGKKEKRERDRNIDIHKTPDCMHAHIW